MKRYAIVGLLAVILVLGTWFGVEVLTPTPAGQGAARLVQEWVDGH